MADTIIRRRLKSLRDRSADQQIRAAEARERKAARDAQLVADIAEAARHGVSPYLIAATRRGPIVLPMAAHYGGEPDREARRAEFYAHCALAFGFRGWILDNPTVQMAVNIGYGGQGRSIRVIDQEQVAPIDIMAAPFEWLFATGKMESKLDTPGTGLLRYTAGIRYRDDMEGAGLGLRAQSYEGASGGGQPNRPPSDFRMDCIRAIAELRAIRDYKVLEAVVWRDEWIWRVSLKRPLPEGKPGKKHRRERQARARVLKELQRRMTRNILKVHRALDQAARYYGLMNAAEYEKRWHKR
jgi:hypothetical protein